LEGVQPYHERDEELAASLTHRRLEVPQAVEHSWQEQRDVVAEVLRRAHHAEA
jgi:hypothetical protein